MKNWRIVIVSCWSIVLLAFLIGTSCNPAKKATEVRKITIGVEGKQFITADFYLPQSGAPHSALIISLAQKDEPKKWAAFAHKVAGMNYAAMVFRDAPSAKDNSPTAANSERIIHSAIASLRSQSIVKIHKVGVMGVGSAGISAIQAAASDTTVSAVITLCAPAQTGRPESDSAWTKHPPRPLLVIASTKDPLAPAEESQKFYDAAKEPKKLVWLATDKHGAELLMTDMEPIVRRVILMLLERHLK